MAAPGPARRRSPALALVGVLLPPVAWLCALGLSYLVQDFACTAYASAGHSPPATVIGAVVVGLDVVLLALAVSAGIMAWRVHRQARDTEPSSPLGFLGLLGLLLSVGFGAGIVLVAVNPLVLEVCA
ncbi:hypothetical protein [Promicromonospora iranensis]|uniref:Uncharacterized protein n=1 Tax=Promicromonospora iranensis TaxID=1105144 RepID=A0ABU2CI77_9MICO|nr:hypothetical protein [Promicromonospora iranensis]MDR7381036.1 hypothetical protein [Promicromonospora iranensis]